MMTYPLPFLTSLTGKIYKLIPMRDDQESGKDVFLHAYIDSLLIELVGAMDTYDVLRGSSYYISIVNTMQYFAHNKVDHKSWRREAFKMLSTLRKMQEQFGGGASADGC